MAKKKPNVGTETAATAATGEKIHRNFTISIETMKRMDLIEQTIGMSKKDLAILVIRAIQKKLL